MKKGIHRDERIDGIRYGIYFKVFWLTIIADAGTYLFDYFLKTNVNGWVLELAPVILIVWMSRCGVLYNGVEKFPRWCWIVSVAYASINSLTMFVMTSISETTLFLSIKWQRALVSIITFFVFFLISILFFYCTFRIAQKKIKMLTEEEY